MSYEQWINQFTGAYAVLCGDVDVAVEVASEWLPADVDLDNDCPIESARSTFAADEAAVA